MKISDFNAVAKHVAQLRKLQAARDAARYDSVTVLVAREGNKYDITELTSASDCRHALIEMLDRHIAGVRAALQTYKVEIDE